MSGMVREVPLPCRSDDSDCELTTADMVPALNGLPTLWAPDRRPAYSNLGFSLLGRILELTSPWQPYEQCTEPPSPHHGLSAPPPHTHTHTTFRLL